MMNTMGEVATLTDKLALMPDQMLPRLAQQYKGDAITLSLILSEKNRRDRLRTAAAAQAAQPQPKVNDQVVAGMQSQLPEQVGIGALPAPNMQRFDEGGIVGYADGGPNPASGPAGQLAYNNEPVLRMAGGGMTPETGFVGDSGAPKLTDAQLSSEYRQALQNGQQNRAQALKAELDYRAGAMKKYQQYASGGVARYDDGGLLGNLIYGNITPVERARRERLAAEAEANRRTTRPSTYEEERQRNMQEVANQGYTRTDPRALPNMPSPAAQLAQAALPPVPDGKGGLGDLAPPPAASGATAPAAPNMGSIRSQFLEDVKGMAPKTETSEDFMARRKAMLGDEGEAFSKYEAKLLAQEAAAPREKDESFWMAVTQAGLAAAAGKSTNALQNIAEGFGTGVAGYKEALKDFKKAEQERTKALADIDRARRAEKRGDVDAALAHEDKSQQRMDEYNRYKLSGLASLAGHEVSGQYSLAGHQVSAAATREANQTYRQGMLENRQMGMVENIRKNIETRLAPQFLADPAGLAAEVERRLQVELQRYPDLAKYAGTPQGAGAAQTGQWGQMSIK